MRERGDAITPGPALEELLLRPVLPPALQVEISSHCNLTCRMCPLTMGQTRSGLVPGPMREVLWQQIVPMARKVGLVMVVGFGEPLLNPACLQLLQELDRDGVWIGLSTNATAITPAFARALAALRNLMHVNISIDSPDPIVYREIRGGSLEQALKGVRNLMAVMDKTRNVTVSSVGMASNLASLPAFPRLLATLGIREYVLQGLTHFDPASAAECLVDAPDLAKHLARLRIECSTFGIQLQCTIPERLDAQVSGSGEIVSRYYERPSSTSGQTRQCTVPWEVPYIDKDGMVFPCCVAAGHGSEALGDLRQESFEDVWNDRAFEKFRRGLLNGGESLPHVCRGCTVAPLGQHPYKQYAAKLLPERSMLRGRDRLCLVAQNAGAITWTRETLVRIATAEPRDHPSPLHCNDWLSANRVATFVEESVEPGACATFAFCVDGRIPECIQTFQLVIDGRCWLPNTGFSVDTGP